MGANDDRDAVVDPRNGRVYGVDRLRVVDASIKPTAPRANLNASTIMMADACQTSSCRIARPDACERAPRTAMIRHWMRQFR